MLVEENTGHNQVGVEDKDEDGYDEDGYDKDGFDKDGYDEYGYDENGYGEDGNSYKSGYTRSSSVGYHSSDSGTIDSGSEEVRLHIEAHWEKLRDREEQHEVRYTVKAKARDIEIDYKKGEQVQEALRFLETATMEGRSVPIGATKGKGRWNLHCWELFEHYYIEVHVCRRQISFNGSEYAAIYAAIHSDKICNPGQVSAFLNIEPGGYFVVPPFDLPTHASLEPVLVAALEGYGDLAITFLGRRFRRY